MPKPITLALFDVESTGLDHTTEDICQFACVVHSSTLAVPLAFETLCNPGKPIHPDTTAIHGITDDMVIDSVPAKELVQEWIAELVQIADGGTVLLGGHNTQFDWNFIKKHVVIPDNFIPLCTMRLARRLLPLADNHKLEYLYREHYKLSSPRTLTAHDALCDVWMCYELLQQWSPDFSLCEEFANQLKTPVKLAVMPFGKFKGQHIRSLPQYYLKFLHKLGDSTDIDVAYSVDLIVKGGY